MLRYGNLMTGLSTSAKSGILPIRTKSTRLRNRKSAFIRETGTRKTCRTTLITSSGLKPNKYRWTAEAELSLDDLFQ